VGKTRRTNEEEVAESAGGPMTIAADALVVILVVMVVIPILQNGGPMAKIRRLQANLEQRRIAQREMIRLLAEDKVAKEAKAEHRRPSEKKAQKA
jgi:hypothetical protein